MCETYDMSEYSLFVLFQTPLALLPPQKPPSPLSFLPLLQLRLQALPYAVLVIFTSSRLPFKVQVPLGSPQSQPSQSASQQEVHFEQVQLQEAR